MKTDLSQQIVWYFMATAISIIIIGGSAWATSINAKVERIASLEANVNYIQKDISEIKTIIKEVFKGVR